MEYESAAEAAKRLGVTVRAVQKWAKEGKIPGATQMGRTWMIPDTAVIPSILRETVSQTEKADVQHVPFPLLNTSYRPGTACATAMAMPDEDDRAIALAEYHYFSGQVELVPPAMERYLDHPDHAVAMSAAFLYLFSNLSLGKVNLVGSSLERIHKETLDVMQTDESPVRRSYAILFRVTAAVLMHSSSAELPLLKQSIHLFPRGLQLFAVYILAYAAYLNKEYEYSRGIAETALSMIGEAHPIGSNYLRTIICIDLMCLRKTEKAKECFLKLWEMARPDGGVEVVGEHHLMLHGLAEICLKRQHPDEYKQIIAVSKRFGVTWRKIHQNTTGRLIAEGLTITEFSIAMLYHRGWAVKEIALHMEMSERMIKHHIAMIYEKLGVSNRAELSKHMLS